MEGGETKMAAITILFGFVVNLTMENENFKKGVNSETMKVRFGVGAGVKSHTPRNCTIKFKNLN